MVKNLGKEFVFKTIEGVWTYKGATGIVYSSVGQFPFKVTDKEDIKFFEENKRFSEAGKFVDEPTNKAELMEKSRSKLYLRLKHLRLITEKSADELARIFGSEKDLIESLKKGDFVYPWSLEGDVKERKKLTTYIYKVFKVKVKK